MRHFTLKIRFQGGGPLIGGAAPAHPGFHASHAQLDDGRPYIPATALRGALRESFEAVLRGSGEHDACDGGSGIDPARSDAGAPRVVHDRPCVPANGPRESSEAVPRGAGEHRAHAGGIDPERSKAGATRDPVEALKTQLDDDRPYTPATAPRQSSEAVPRGAGEHRAYAGGIDPERSKAGAALDPLGASKPRPVIASAEAADADTPTEAEAEAGAALDPLGASKPRPVIASAEAADADTPTEAEADRRCTLGGDGAPCLACRLFGTGRRNIGKGERAFSALVVGDAMVPDGASRWMARPSVAMARARRSAADNLLVFRRIPAPLGDALEFTAPGWVNDPALEQYLEAAARATTHLGAGRSRGLAHVEIKVSWDAETAHTRATLSPDANGDLRLRVTLTSPALVGAAVIDGNYRETRHEIPGATVRGAIGFALRELLDDADHDAATQDLLDPERGAHFGFLYPADPPPRAATAPISGPFPITAAWCKRERRNHGVVDTLLDRLVLLHAVSAAAAESAAQRSATRCTCMIEHRDKPSSVCDEPLRTAHGSRLATAPVKTRTIVRVAMDRARQSAQDGQLYSQVLLAPGTVLEGSIRRIPARSRARLVQALGSGILSFGRGRSAGWGQARIDVEPGAKLPSVAERAAAFDRALRARLDAAGLTSDRIGRLVPVTLLSPLWPSRRATPPDDDDDGARELCDAIGPAACFLSARRFARDGSWDQRTGAMTAFRATAAGGVFVLELARATWRDVVDRLDALERDGIGLRRDQGYGQLLCFDPHFLVSSQNG